MEPEGKSLPLWGEGGVPVPVAPALATSNSVCSSLWSRPVCLNREPPPPSAPAQPTAVPDHTSFTLQILWDTCPVLGRGTCGQTTPFVPSTV